MKLLIVTLFILVTKMMFGQSQHDYTKPVQILPPAPNAASLGKYGGINVGLASGAANFTIPIYEFTSSHLKLPISLSYTSTGFKVDEIASRVGLSWALHAGGVITRTVFGSVDERSIRIYPPAGHPRNRDMLNFLKTIHGEGQLTGGQGPYGTYDGQPDLFNFNFNGYSGQFILDDNRDIYQKKPILLTHSNIKIEQATTNQDGYRFKATTPDGVQYLFDRGDFTMSMTATGGRCGFIYDQYVPTAWYVSKIIHPNKDTIIFTYSNIQYEYITSTSETIYKTDATAPTPHCFFRDPPPQQPIMDLTCQTKLQTTGVLLETIHSTAGGKVKFNYINRTDYNDKLLSSIEVIQPGQTAPFRIFDLAYEYHYRPFLSGLTEKSPNGALTKKNAFLYHDINSTPPHLSYSQDHWGYYNGKQNFTLIPPPSNVKWRVLTPNANANRNPDSIYAMKGLLSAIYYPTGGKDSIIYGGNMYYGTAREIVPDTTVSMSATSSGGVVSVYSNWFTNNIEQAAVISMYRPNITVEDSALSSTYVTIYDASNNIIYNKTLDNPDYTSEWETFKLPVGTFRIQLGVWISYGSGTGGASLTFRPREGQLVSRNIASGGVRVTKVITTDPVSGKSAVKKYIYNKLSTPEKSSGVLVNTQGVQENAYEQKLIIYNRCFDVDEGNPCNLLYEYWYYTMHSNSLFNLMGSSLAPATYGTVIESFGENFENGGIEHEFIVYTDEYPVDFVGMIKDAPGSSYGHVNGKEIYQHVFRRAGSNIIPVKKVYTHYKEDLRISGEYYGYMTNRYYIDLCNHTSEPDDYEWKAFDMSYYRRFRTWVYVDTVRTLTYDNSGQQYVEEKTITDYANKDHTLPTKITTTESTGKITVVNNYYAPDLVLTGGPETARQAMVARQIIAPVLQQQTTVDGVQTVKTTVDYSVFPSGLVLPQNISAQIRNNSLEKRIEFHKYSDKGKLIEQSKANDALQSYIWDYQSLYPIAEVNNASSDQIAYTSFEGDGKGGFSFSGTPLADASAITGKKVYGLNGSNGIVKSGLNSSATYIVSYWTKNSTPFSIAGTQSGYPIAGQSVNGWKYFEHKVTGQTQITLSGTNGLIDELRVFPVGAGMTTYTYEPLVGITSQCDMSNKIIYYEYDALGRLLFIRDENKNIIKKYCYNYAGQSENCN